MNTSKGLDQIKLTYKQTQAWKKLKDDSTREVLFGGGAGGAKSFLGCFWILHDALKYPRTRYVIGRSKLKTLKATTLNTFFEVERMIRQMYGISDKPTFSLNNQSNIITIKSTESQILLKDLFLYPSDPEFDELGSLEITSSFVDEVNQVSEKAWNVLRSRTRFKLDEYGLMPKQLGTCNPSKGWVFRRFYEPFKSGRLPEDRAFIQSLLSDNPHIDSHYRENLEGLDEASVKRLLYGLWEYDADIWKLFGQDETVAIFQGPKLEEEELKKVDPKHRFLSVDVARYGSDKAVFCVWYDHTVAKIMKVDSSSTTDIEAMIRKLEKEHDIPRQNIVIDEDGVGGGVVDHISGCVGFVNNSRPLSGDNYANLKSQCFFKFAEWVRNGDVRILDKKHQDAIAEELDVIRQHKGDSDGKLAVEPKEMMKDKLGRSPDFADALMMRFRFDVESFSAEYVFA